MADERKSPMKHRVIMEQRESVAMTGILDVISFDEEMILAETDLGMIVIKGLGLHVNRLNLDNGELDIAGEVTSLAYEDTTGFARGKSSFLSKLFK